MFHSWSDWPSSHPRVIRVLAVTFAPQFEIADECYLQGPLTREGSTKLSLEYDCLKNTFTFGDEHVSFRIASDEDWR
jgi:hypothetical protein